MLSRYKWYFSWPWYKWYPQAVASIIEAQLSFILDDVKVAPLLFSFEINVQLPEDMQEFPCQRTLGNVTDLEFQTIAQIGMCYRDKDTKKKIHFLGT